MATSNEIAIIVLGTLILLLFAFYFFLFLIAYKKKQYQNVIEKQQLTLEYHNQLLLTKLEVQEQAYKYFSEEIHDNVGQLLSLAKLQLYSIKNKYSEGDVVKDVEDCNEVLSKAITDLRAISHNLNSNYIARVGICEALEKELNYISATKSISSKLYKEGEEYELGHEKELLVFRIIQEAISNALRHASPSLIDVYITYGKDSLTVCINDNGSGFDTNSTGDGIGLANMQVRAEMLKGKLNIRSAPGEGTKVQFEVKTQ